MLRVIRRTRSLLGVAGATAVLSCGYVGASHARKPARHTIMIDGTSFSPDVLTVRAGDTIVWLNKDIIPHTATSKTGGFDSSVIATDESWTYETATKGEFPYVCTFHPTMTGRLRIR